MQARFVKMTPENTAGTIASFYFKPDREYRFTAGQYADITVIHDRPDSRGMTRTMTFSSSPASDLLRFTTRVGAENNSTYKQALLRLKPADPVVITDAMGDMVLPLDPAIPLVFVAGGVGIASYVGIIEWLTAQKDKRTITILYAVRTSDDIIFQKEFDAYNTIEQLTEVIHTPDVTVPSALHRKVTPIRLTGQAIVARMQDASQIYLSGTERMVEQLRDELQTRYGVEQYRIVFDYFDGYSSDI